MVGIHVQELYQAARIAPGSDPGRVTYPYKAYSTASFAVNASSPAAEKIQPMALPGRWATIKAPTIMKALKPSVSPTWPAASGLKVPLWIDRTIADTMLTR